MKGFCERKFGVQLAPLTSEVTHNRSRKVSFGVARSNKSRRNIPIDHAAINWRRKKQHDVQPTRPDDGAPGPEGRPQNGAAVSEVSSLRR